MLQLHVQCTAAMICARCLISHQFHPTSTACRLLHVSVQHAVHCSVIANSHLFAIWYLWQGVTPSSKILHTDSTSIRECRDQKTEKNYAYTVCTKPHIFSSLGAPISGQGADICMLSLPSARGWYMLKIRSDGNSSYGHSKTDSGNADVFATFSQKRRSYLGACCCPGPSAHNVQHGCALQIDVISLHNCMWTKFRGVPIFRGERFKYFSKISRKIGSTLGAWRSTTPANIKI